MSYPLGQLSIHPRPIVPSTRDLHLATYHLVVRGKTAVLQDSNCPVFQLHTYKALSQFQPTPDLVHSPILCLLSATRLVGVK